MSRSVWSLLILSVSIGLVGCRSESAQLGTVPVSGVVTLDGRPLAGASVTFSPTGSEGRAAAGTTDIDGRFKLTTVTAGDGAVPGTYAVTITKYTAGADAPSGDARHTGGTMTPEETQAMMESIREGKVAKPQSEVPSKYSSKDTSNLSATVEKGQENNFTFELTSS